MSVTSNAETIRIEAPTRWDAADLAQRLTGLDAYLVQLGDRRWHICIRVDRAASELLPVVRRAAEAWARERGLDAVIRVGEQTIRV